jgi:hypothetical protein
MAARYPCGDAGYPTPIGLRPVDPPPAGEGGPRDVDPNDLASNPELLAQDPLVEIVAGVEQNPHSDVVFHAGFDRVPQR